VKRNRDRVLRRMLEEKAINQQEYQQAATALLGKAAPGATRLCLTMSMSCRNRSAKR